MSATNRGLRQGNVDIITAELHRLTEMVYNTVVSSRINPTIAQRRVADCYKKCLEWYESFFDLVNKNGPRTPFTIFIQ